MLEIDSSQNKKVLGFCFGLLCVLTWHITPFPVFVLSLLCFAQQQHLLETVFYYITVVGRIIHMIFHTQRFAGFWL